MNWADTLQGIVLAVGLVALWLCFIHGPEPKRKGTKRDGLGRS